MLLHKKICFHTESLAVKEKTVIVCSNMIFFKIFMNVGILCLPLIILISFLSAWTCNKQYCSTAVFSQWAPKVTNASTLHCGKKQSSRQQFKAIISSIKITPTITCAITLLLKTEMPVQNQLGGMLVGHVKFSMFLVSIRFTPCWLDEHRTRGPLYEETQC